MKTILVTGATPGFGEAAVPRFVAGGWVAIGQITSRETVRDGLEAAPQAFLDLFSGANMGKMLVRL